MAYRRIFDPVQERWRAYDCDALKWQDGCRADRFPKIGPYSRYKHILKAWTVYWDNIGAWYG